MADKTANKRSPKEGYDTELIRQPEAAPDPGSPFYDAQLRQETARKELLRDRAARYSEVNPPINGIGHISGHPREFRPYKIIERADALNLLRVPSSELSRLIRCGSVRRAHPQAWSGLVYDDVALLAATDPKTPARKDAEARLRMQNIDTYLSAFAPSAYYEMDGTPKSPEAIEEADKEGKYAYEAGLAGLPAKFRSVMRPVPHNLSKDHKAAHDVQFLYMADEPTPHMTTALLMRRWYRETHPHARYNVARIAIPPVEALSRPEHSGVLKFLVEAASILYQVDFEAMPRKYYDAILSIQESVHGIQEEDMPLPNLYMELTGAQISTEDDLHTLLSTQDATAALPLRYQVAAWYQAYKTLMGPGPAPMFTIKRTKYVDSLVHTMTGTSAADYTPSSAAVLRRKVEQLIGCSSDMAPLYRPERPPLYVGEPPAYWEASGNRKLHKGLLNTTLSYNVEILMAANSLADATDKKLEASKVLNNSLPGFHQTIAEMMPPTTKTKQDKLMVSLLFSCLSKHGVDPHSLYLYPYRDAEALAEGLEDKLAAVIRDMSELTTPSGDRPEPGTLADIPNPHEIPSLVGSDITADMRTEYAHEFAVAALGFTEADLTGMAPGDIVESLPDTQALDEYIIRTANSDAMSLANIINLEEGPQDEDLPVIHLDEEDPE